MAEAIRAGRGRAVAGVRREHRSATPTDVLERAGHTPTKEFLAATPRASEPHTFTDPDAASVLRSLHARGIRIGVLSNTMSPRLTRGRVPRDRVLDLIDGAGTAADRLAKPHPGAFRAAMQRSGPSDPARCVFIGDRPYDDVHGTKSAGSGPS